MKKKKPKKNNFLEEQYSLSLKYLKESKKFIYWIVGIFFFFVLIGFFVPVPESIASKLAEIIQELIAQTEGLSRFELIRFIFLNNLWSSFIGMIFGFFFGIFSILVAVFNGYLLGFVSSLVVKEENIFVLWRLLPHGVFELPAIFISLGLGLRFGTFFLKKNKADAFRKYFWNSIRVFLTIVFPLLVVAAIIEGLLISLFG